MEMCLRDYQIDLAKSGIAILKKYHILCLSMEVRCGKTLTALAVATNGGYKSVLVITKKKAILSIKSDYKLLNPDFKLEVTNYEQVKKIDPDLYDLVIVDESHSCGAFPKPSQRTVLVRNLCIGKHIILLSGTFSPESYSQLYHQLALSSYSPFAQYTNFYKWAKAGFVNIKQKRIGTGQLINDYSNANGDMIWRYIKHLFLTFTQAQAGFSSTIDEKFLTVKMSYEIGMIYRELQREGIYIRTIAGRELVATVNGGADLINKLSQISSGTLIFDDEPKGIIIDHSKALFIQREFHGKKLAIFYRFKCEFELLKHFFPHYTESPEEFNAWPNSEITFLGQIQSAREGVNVSTADMGIGYNIDFSATSYFQLPARIQHKDRKKTPFYWVFNEIGIEQRVFNAVSNKINFTHSYYKSNARKENSKENKGQTTILGLQGTQAH